MYNLHSSDGQATIAEELTDIFIEDKEMNYYTFTTNRDYEEIIAIDRLVTEYEGQLAWTKEDLSNLNRRVRMILSKPEERINLEIRVYFLEKLYETNDKVSRITNTEEIELLIKTLVQAKSSSVKIEVLTKLNQRKEKLQASYSLNEKQNGSINAITSLNNNSVEALYKLIKEKSNNQFIHIGIYACHSAIKNILNSNAALSSIDELMTEFDNQVEKMKLDLIKLSQAKHPQEVVQLLDLLPIQNYNSLKTDTKNEIASNLLIKKEWNIDLPRLSRLVNLELIKIKKESSELNKQSGETLKPDVSDKLKITRETFAELEIQGRLKVNSNLEDFVLELII